MTDYATLAQLFYNGSYFTLASLVDAATGVNLERGVADDLDLKTGVCTFRLNDAADRYRPSNAASDLYGQTGQYMRGAFATGLSVRFTGETQYMNPGQTDDHQTAVEHPWRWDFESGVGDWQGYDATVAAATDAWGGGFGGVLRMTTAPGVGATQAYTAPAAVPATAAATYRAEMWVYLPVAATVTAAMDFTGPSGYLGGQYPTFAVPAATWTKLVVTGTAVPGTTYVVAHPTIGAPVPTGLVLYLGLVTLWDTAAPTMRGRRWVDVKLGGPLTRVGYWRDPLASPLFTSITGQYAANLRGYFTLEDGRDSTALANTSHPTKTGRFNAVTLGSADGPGGASTALEMTASGSFTTPYASMSTTAGWQLAFAVRTTTVDGTQRDLWTFRTTNGYTWRWRADTTNYNLRITDPDGVVILDEFYSYGGGAGPGQWVYTRLKVQINAGTVKIEPSWYTEAADTFYGVTTSYAGTNMGAPTQSTVSGNVATTGARYSHHFVVTGVTNNLESGDFTEAFVGYRRETAAERFARLCTSRGLEYLIRGTGALTAAMGTQPLETFQDQLKQIRVSEGGLIFDRGDNIGIVFATRDYLYSQAAAPVLDVIPTQLSGTLQEVTSAVDLYNLITAENLTGSSATAELATGRYGTQTPPAGAGRLDKTVKVNLASDGPLSDVANWWLRFWTQAGPRFDTITIDVDNQPGLLTACNAAEPGMFIRLTGRTPDPLLLLILTTGQRTNRKRNVFTFGVAAGAIFGVGVYDAAGSRYDSSSTTLAAGATATANTLALTTRNYHDRWSTTSLPYALMVAGERVTATGMTAAVSSGGVWTQTATVTRSVNGVVKAQASGAVVQLADPAYYG